MFRAVVKILVSLLAGWLCFVIGKVIFIIFNPAVYSDLGFGNLVSAIAHGWAMDLSISAYITAIPALLCCCALVWGSRGIINRITTVYYAVISALTSLIIIADTSIYGYWGFKLDSTPLFYFATSPSAALASVEWWMYALGILGWGILTAMFFCIFRLAVVIWPGEINAERGWHLAGSLTAGLIATGLLFIPIRGSLTVSTMNLSRAYFSPDQRLNHAAVNPAFSLMESLSEQTDFAGQFRFFTEEKNAELFKCLSKSTANNITSLLRPGAPPDIYLIILESFSSHLFPSLGGEAVAVKLDSIAARGLVYDNFYANSFRTDRGLVAILSGYPAQPNTSIMKFVAKTENLPSLSRALKEKKGYDLTYYYGGDANFTNMKAYLVNSGFERIISDADFPISKRLSKWGAHDAEVFSRASEDISSYDPAMPKFRVIQTSSSHEPFEVPYDARGRLTDKRAVAFAYTDSCTAAFVDKLRADADWDNTLVVIVPDHYGAYPELTDPVERHSIPLILTGGALARRGIDHTPGSQTDITAIILGAVGSDHSEFPFSRNLSNPHAPHFGFFADPEVAGFITESDTALLNLTTELPERGTPQSIDYIKTILQTLYNDLSRR